MRRSEYVNEFFKSIRDSGELLLFKKLYNDPESVLGSSRDMDEAAAEYYDLPDYFRLMMNNRLTAFVQAVHYDYAFSIKAFNNPQILRKLKFFVYDSLVFKKYYHLYEDENLVAVVNNKMPVKEYLRKEGSLCHWQLYEFYGIFKEYEGLFKHGYQSELIDAYDEQQAIFARKYLTDDIEDVKERLAKAEDIEKIKRDVFSRIEKEDCTETATFLTFLCGNPIFEPEDYYENAYFYTRYAWVLLCQNRFLKIIEEKMVSQQLGGIPLDNAINIISFSIAIKKRSYPEAVYYQREIVDPEAVEEFDVEYAKKLCTKLIIYRNFRLRTYREYLKVVK